MTGQEWLALGALLCVRVGIQCTRRRDLEVVDISGVDLLLTRVGWFGYGRMSPAVIEITFGYTIAVLRVHVCGGDWFKMRFQAMLLV